MPIVPFQVIMKDAFEKRYGVGAFNIINDLTMEAVLQAAERPARLSLCKPLSRQSNPSA